MPLVFWELVTTVFSSLPVVNSSSQAFSGLPSWRCSWVQKPPRSASTAIALGQPGCARNRGTVLAFRAGITRRGGRPAAARSAAPPAAGCASAAAAPSPAPIPSPAARNCLLSMILSDPTQRRCFSYQLTFGLRQAVTARRCRLELRSPARPIAAPSFCPPTRRATFEAGVQPSVTVLLLPAATFMSRALLPKPARRQTSSSLFGPAASVAFSSILEGQKRKALGHCSADESEYRATAWSVSAPGCPRPTQSSQLCTVSHPY